MHTYLYYFRLSLRHCLESLLWLRVKLGRELAGSSLTHCAAKYRSGQAAHTHFDSVAKQYNVVL